MAEAARRPISDRLQTERLDAAMAVPVPREQWVDTLRVVVIAAVIVVHAATAYIVPIDWYYQERTTSELWPLLLSFPAGIGGIFALGPLFFVAGWLSLGSLVRRGRAEFVQARFLRLAVPLVVFVLVVDPLADYIGDVGEGLTGPFLDYFHPDSAGPMWFVAALLAFSVAYAALRGPRPRAASPRTLRPTVLVVAAAAIAISSMAVWQLWPLTGETYLDLRFGQWPQGAVLFALGVHAAEAGWLNGIPPTLVRGSGWIAAIGLAAFVTLLAMSQALGQFEAVMTGFGWPTILLAVLDGVIAVCGTLWLIAWLRDRWARQGVLLGLAGRASYAAYFAHPLLLTILSVLLAPIALAPELKLVVVAPVAVPAIFAVGYALTRVPGISKVL
jgi:glucan biosynthesis protein C